MKNINKVAITILVASCLALLMVGCGKGGIESDFADIKESVSNDEITVKDDVGSNQEEEPLTSEEMWRFDAENDAVTMIISQYKLEDSDQRYVDMITFNDFIESFKDIKENNLFADSLITASQNVDYDEYSTVEKVVFDTYLGLLFQDDVVRKNLPIGNIIEAWHGEGYVTDKSGSEHITQYYLLKFSEYNDKDSLTSSNFVFLHDMDIGEDTFAVLKAPNQYLDNEYGDYRNCFFEQDGKMALVTLFHGSIYLDAVDVSDLNNIIDLNQNFIDFMLNYRNDIYAPIRTAQLDAEKERKEAQRVENEYWENKIPEIGMTAEEVKKTSWGNPDKINKDTYAWGTTEQWVYSSKGYVYFRDGIVSSISER